jgi:hypothetical protein
MGYGSNEFNVQSPKVDHTGCKLLNWVFVVVTLGCLRRIWFLRGPCRLLSIECVFWKVPSNPYSEVGSWEGRSSQWWGSAR